MTEFLSKDHIDLLTGAHLAECERLQAVIAKETARVSVLEDAGDKLENAILPILEWIEIYIANPNLADLAANARAALREWQAVKPR